MLITQALQRKSKRKSRLIFPCISPSLTKSPTTALLYKVSALWPLLLLPSSIPVFMLFFLSVLVFLTFGPFKILFILKSWLRSFLLWGVFPKHLNSDLWSMCLSFGYGAYFILSHVRVCSHSYPSILYIPRGQRWCPFFKIHISAPSTDIENDNI